MDGWEADRCDLDDASELSALRHNFPYYYADYVGDQLYYAIHENGIIATDYDCLMGQFAAQGPNHYMAARMHRMAFLPAETLAADLDSDGRWAWKIWR